MLDRWVSTVLSQEARQDGLYSICAGPCEVPSFAEALCPNFAFDTCIQSLYGYMQCPQPQVCPSQPRGWWQLLGIIPGVSPAPPSLEIWHCTAQVAVRAAAADALMVEDPDDEPWEGRSSRGRGGRGRGRGGDFGGRGGGAGRRPQAEEPEEKEYGVRALHALTIFCLCHACMRACMHASSRRPRAVTLGGRSGVALDARSACVRRN